jgi:hypothetical protein
MSWYTRSCSHQYPINPINPETGCHNGKGWEHGISAVARCNATGRHSTLARTCGGGAQLWNAVALILGMHNGEFVCGTISGRRLEEQHRRGSCDVENRSVVLR